MHWPTWQSWYSLNYSCKKNVVKSDQSHGCLSLWLSSLMMGIPCSIMVIKGRLPVVSVNGQNVVLRVWNWQRVIMFTAKLSEVIVLWTWKAQVHTREVEVLCIVYPNEAFTDSTHFFVPIFFITINIFNSLLYVVPLHKGFGTYVVFKQDIPHLCPPFSWLAILSQYPNKHILI